MLLVPPAKKSFATPLIFDTGLSVKREAWEGAVHVPGATVLAYRVPLLASRFMFLRPGSASADALMVSMRSTTMSLFPSLAIKKPSRKPYKYLGLKRFHLQGKPKIPGFDLWNFVFRCANPPVSLIKCTMSAGGPAKWGILMYSLSAPPASKFTHLFKSIIPKLKRVALMEICVLNPYFYPYKGGTEKVLLEVYGRLAKRHNITVLTSTVPGRNEKRREEINGITVIRLRTKQYALPGLPLPFESFTDLNSEIKKARADLYHINNRYQYFYFNLQSIK